MGRRRRRVITGPVLSCRRGPTIAAAAAWVGRIGHLAPPTVPLAAAYARRASTPSTERWRRRYRRRACRPCRRGGARGVIMSRRWLAAYRRIEMVGAQVVDLAGRPGGSSLESTRNCADGLLFQRVGAAINAPSSVYFGRRAGSRKSGHKCSGEKASFYAGASSGGAIEEQSPAITRRIAAATAAPVRQRLPMAGRAFPFAAPCAAQSADLDAIFCMAQASSPGSLTRRSRQPLQSTDAFHLGAERRSEAVERCHDVLFLKACVDFRPACCLGINENRPAALMASTPHRCI